LGSGSSPSQKQLKHALQRIGIHATVNAYATVAAKLDLDYSRPRALRKRRARLRCAHGCWGRRRCDLDRDKGRHGLAA
jgi:hypothetical protein